MTEQNPPRCNLQKVGVPHYEGEDAPFQTTPHRTGRGKGRWVEQYFVCEGGCPLTDGKTIQAIVAAGPETLEQLETMFQGDRQGCQYWLDWQARRRRYSESK